MYEYYLAGAIVVSMVGIMFYLFRIHMKNKQVFYTSPFREAELVFEKIKNSNPMLFDSLSDAENTDEVLRSKSFVLSKFIQSENETKASTEEILEASIKTINEILLIILVFKKIKEDRLPEIAKIGRGLRRVKSILDEARKFVLERLSKKPNSRTFYLQKTILNYADDFDDFLKSLDK